MIFQSPTPSPPTRDFRVFYRQNPRAFFEQLRESARGGVAYHLRYLSHREIGVYQQVLRLTHAPSLDILRDRASRVPLEAGFQLAFAHAGDSGEAGQRYVKGIMVGNVAYHVSQSLGILL